MTVSKGLFVAATALSGVSALQIPQIPLGGLEELWKPSTGNDLTGLPVIDTKALQKLITADNLETRAKDFYEIAKLGQEEYNHPTRVIGSKGRSRCNLRACTCTRAL